MHRKIIAVGLGILAMAPAAAAAQDQPKSAQETCRAEREAIGTAAFRDLYGTNANKANAFGKCVSKARKREDAAKASAAKTCKAEETADPAAFAAKYGTGKKGKNAFGKCVSQTAKAAREREQTERVNAAKQCKAQRKADPAAFAETYGSKRNAFGKCVSRTAAAA